MKAISDLKNLRVFLALLLACLISFTAFAKKESKELLVFAGAGKKAIGMAVEFVDHAASAHIAKNKGWFKAEGLNITSFDNYITGMALAAALTRGDINVAYVCLIPAIS
ncbi:MAG: hypothetical protein JRE64_12960, partial [Deltaproteobacteria bacterium]|nr:hypothetical protein [Deltaproteobacteria bacterium]